MKNSPFRFSDPQIEKMIFIVNENWDNHNKKEIEIKNQVIQNINKDKRNSAIVALITEVGGKSDDYPFFIHLKMSALFGTDELIDDDKFKKLIDINAPALLLSYSRPIISLITSQSAISSLNLPFVNFTID